MNVCMSKQKQKMCLRIKQYNPIFSDILLYRQMDDRHETEGGCAVFHQCHPKNFIAFCNGTCRVDVLRFDSHPRVSNYN